MYGVTVDGNGGFHQRSASYASTNHVRSDCLRPVAQGHGKKLA